MLDRSRDAIARRRKLDPYAKVRFRRVTLDRRTRAAFLLMERRYRAVAPRKRAKLRIGQGSYSYGSLSGSTHAQGGALDVMFAGLNPKQQRAVVKFGRLVGFAMWGRTDPAVWGYGNAHAHGILRGHRTASAAAKSQVVAYDAGRDGLVSNRADTEWRPKVKRRFSYIKMRPVLGK
ncbi:MAG: hypothetical protein R2686_07055 [Candidatus Nanopelagicales bacterium]